ncbi:hypothetical protein MKW92_050640 [Papaver armeniacum]|nr:hypothetical protein MKW92_050640 [Papaver armeniacum]
MGLNIYKLTQGEQLLVDAPEMIEKALSSEQDPSAKRNAFLMLFTCAQERAVSYLLTHMVVLELIRKVCRTNREEKGKYIKIIISLAAANTYCQLLQSQSDNNVKLIVLDQLNELKTSYREIMVDMIMDTIDIALELITPRNIDEVVQALKKEVVKTRSTELEKNKEYLEKNGEYCQMLVQAIHSCAINFLEVASTVVHLLMDFKGDSNHMYVCSCALWIIGEYCLSLSDVESGLATIKQYPQFLLMTYATHNAASETAISPPTLVGFSLILTGDFFLGAVLACTLAKLILSSEEVQPSKPEVNKAFYQALLVMASMLQLGQSSFLSHLIDNDSYDTIVLCIRLLCNTGDEIRKIWIRETEEIKAKARISHAQPDDLIDIYHLRSRKGMSQLELEDEVQDDLKRATGEFTKDGDGANKLQFSDPVYAEAYVTVHHYDIVLDVMVINHTKETLQNLCLELATMGDFKLVERPQNYTLAPESSKQIRANIKVYSTETGLTIVVLIDTHIDIMDYISAATRAGVAFRTVWAEFEWENKTDGEGGFLHSIILLSILATSLQPMQERRWITSLHV